MDADLPKSPWKRTIPFRVGDVEAHPASGELRGRRGVERIRPLLMDLLQRLAAEPGAVVRRETLLEEVWQRRMVNDEVLSRAVAELRTALGDDARDARFIETLPKIGYRLVAEVRPVEGDAALVQAMPDAAIVQDRAAIPGPALEATADVVRSFQTPWLRWQFAIALVSAAVVVAALAWWAIRHETSDTASLERRFHAARPLTSDPGLEIGPRFSPDGKQVVYAQVVGETFRIVVRGLDGTVRTTIGGNDAVMRLSPVFFPDGRKLAYWRSDNERCAIAVWDLDAARETRELVECARRPRARFDLSSDGRWLVFAAPPRPQFPAGLQLLDVQSGTVRSLTAPEPGVGDDIMPRFNADATRIAFFRGNESHRSLWIVAREGDAQAQRISKLDGLSYGAAWMGRDGPLLVAADWLGFRALNLLDVASGEARLAGARGARFPDISIHGEIVYESAMYAANLWRIPVAEGGAATALWPSTRYTNQPEYSPDGQRLVFASNRDGTDGLYVAALDGQPLRIAAGERFRFLRPHWSSDGRFVHAIRITLEPNGTSTQEGVRIAADGSALEVLAVLGTNVNDVRETGDGRWLLWAENTGTAMRLMRAPIDHPGNGERLPWPLVSHFQVHGDRVVLAQPHMPRLMSCRLSTFACEQLEVDVTIPELYNWSVGERSIFLRGPDGRVARFDLATKRVVAVLEAMPSGGGTSIAVSPGEREISFIREEGPAIDLMLVPAAAP